MAFSAFIFPFFLNQACAADNLFNGKWVYKQTCGPQQVASVIFTQKGSEVKGDWSDGSTRGSGVYGKLKGVSKNNKLFVRYCGGDENSGYEICPKYEAEVSDYFVHQGKDLVWYKMTKKKGGDDYEKYLILHPAVNGKPAIVDSRCVDSP